MKPAFKYNEDEVMSVDNLSLSSYMIGSDRKQQQQQS